MNTSTCETLWARIFIAGPIDVAKQLLRAECMREGLCVTIEPTNFIYTGGEEAGYVVGLINYPRFTTSVDALHERALSILHLLLDGTFQKSALLMEQGITTWVSKVVQP